jgi:hypothetical protein
MRMFVYWLFLSKQNKYSFHVLLFMTPTFTYVRGQNWVVSGSGKHEQVKWGTVVVECRKLYSVLHLLTILIILSAEGFTAASFTSVN